MRTRVLQIVLCAMMFCLGGQVGRAYSPERKVGYGGRPWSLAEIFPAGPHRDLAAAAAAGDLRGIDRALKAGADINFRGAGDLTPLWWASWDQNLAGFTRLLERGADPNLLPAQELPVMHQISESLWPIGFLKAALKHRGNPDLERQNGARPIGNAIIQGTKAHFDLLLAANVDVNGNRGNEAPLFTAVVARRYDYILALLEKGADPRTRDVRDQDLAYFIGRFPFNPDGEQYVWRERVIRFLRARGIEAHPPADEGKRTKPLPKDLR